MGKIKHTMWNEKKGFRCLMRNAQVHQWNIPVEMLSKHWRTIYVNRAAISCCVASAIASRQYRKETFRFHCKYCIAHHDCHWAIRFSMRMVSRKFPVSCFLSNIDHYDNFHPHSIKYNFVAEIIHFIPIMHRYFIVSCECKSNISE